MAGDVRVLRRAATTPPTSTRRLNRLKLVSFHEAGHAVAAFAVRRGVRSVTIIPDAESLGRVALHDSRALMDELETGHRGWSADRVRREVEKHIIIAFAGKAVERKLTGRGTYQGAAGGDGIAVDLALAVCGDEEEASAYLAWLWHRTANLMSGPRCWPAIEALAYELRRRKKIGGRLVRAIIADAIAPPVTWQQVGGQLVSVPRQRRFGPRTEGHAAGAVGAAGTSHLQPNRRSP